MIKTVLFDLDDTLFDYQYCRRCGLKVLQSEYSQLRNLSLEELEIEHERLLQANFQQLLDKTITLSEAILERIYLLCLKYGLELSGADLDRASYLYNAEYERTRRTIPGARELLQHLLDRQIKLGVVTNGLTLLQAEKMKICQLDHLIAQVVVSEAIGFRKPDRRIFDAALKRMESTAEETIFIGDSWVTDITGAHRCGMKAIWLNRYGSTCPDHGMALEIKSYFPLEALVKVIVSGVSL